MPCTSVAAGCSWESCPVRSRSCKCEELHCQIRRTSAPQQFSSSVGGQAARWWASGFVHDESCRNAKRGAAFQRYHFLKKTPQPHRTKCRLSHSVVPDKSKTGEGTSYWAVAYIQLKTRSVQGRPHDQAHLKEYCWRIFVSAQPRAQALVCHLEHSHSPHATFTHHSLAC